VDGGDLPQLAQPLVTASGGAHKERPFVVPLLAGERARYVASPSPWSWPRARRSSPTRWRR